MNRRWIDPPRAPAVSGQLAEAFDLPEPLAAALVSRGVDTAEAMEGFLNPRLSTLGDPFLLPGMAAAVERTWQALDAGEAILVFGDYDVDGISSTALVLSVLSALGGQATPFVPNRIADGYGFTASAFEESTRRHRPGLIITVDCGTQAAETVERARRAGMDVVVTDHHEPEGTLAGAAALVNPKLSDDESMRHLAGVGVAFKFCHALLKSGREQGRASADRLDLKRYLDLVALGTIADMVPLRGENRALARHGLARMAETSWPGLRALLEVARVTSPVEAYHVGFQIGPRLNAAGRLGRANDALDLLLSEDAGHAQGLAQGLDAANRERQDIEERMLAEARAELEARFDPAQCFGLVAGRAGWHTGVLGIVASRVAQQFYRPSVMIGFDENGRGRGSCRSIEGFDLVEALAACSEYLERYGGHRMAAGLEIRADRLEGFAERFNAVAAETLQGQPLQPSLNLDAWIDLAEVDDRMYEQLQRLRPFGYGNPTPLWAAAGVYVLQPQTVGRGHLRMILAGGGAQRQAIAFNMADRELPRGAVDVAFRIKRNTFRGQTALQLDVQDVRAAEPRL